MPSSWNTRTIPNTTWGGTRLGGAYLLDWNGDYILDSNSERIIVIAVGGTLPITQWNDYRTYRGQTWTEVSGFTWAEVSSRTWSSFYSGIRPSTYTTRTPI